jgi:hypothetical protein
MSFAHDLHAERRVGRFCGWLRHRRALKSLRGAMELSALSPRAVNALGRHGIRTREQARQANVLERLADERNCGRKTIDEIARWISEDEGQLPATAAAGAPSQGGGSDR